MLSSTTLNTHLRDNLLHICSTTGNLTIGTTGPHAVGMAVQSNIQFTLGGSFSPSDTTAAGLYVNTSISPQANRDALLFAIQGTLVEAGSGTHNLFASAYISPPTITAGAAALTNAASLYLAGIPSGAVNNFAILVDAIGNDGIHVAFGDSTDVAHGITDLAPTTVYGVIRKSSATAGGMALHGFTEDTQAFALVGVATNVVTTEAGASRGIINLFSNVKSGTGTTTAAADDNTVVFVNSTNATHIFKGNGDSYEDGTGWTAFDDFLDVALIEAAEIELTAAEGKTIRQQFSDFIENRRDVLQRLRLITFNEDGRLFVNRSGMQTLLCGAMRQAYQELHELKTILADVLRRLEKLGG